MGAGLAVRRGGRLTTTDGEHKPGYTVRPLRDSGGSRSWAHAGLIAVVLAAAGAILLVPNLLAPAAPASPTPGASLDPHEVRSVLGTYVVSLDGQAMAFVVSRADGGTTTEIGRAVLPADAPPLQSGQPFNGTWGFTMACPGATGSEPIRILFGALSEPAGAQYLGPPATWTIASDGLYLIVLDPGFVDVGAQVRLSTRSGSIGADVRAFDYDLDSGQSQASGCHVA